MKNVCEQCDFFHPLDGKAKCLVTQRIIPTRMRKSYCSKFKIAVNKVSYRNGAKRIVSK